MVTRQRLPEGLAQMPPGPGLCAVLATIDRTRLTSEDLCVFTAARYRLLAHVNAEFLADLYETGQAAHEPAGSLTRTAELKDRAGDQIAWELCVSSSLRRRAARAGSASWPAGCPTRAGDLRAGPHRLRQGPRVRRRPVRRRRRRVARAIAELLLGRAPRWTVAQLRDKLRYHIARAEPDKRRENYLRRVADRRVWLQPFTDGTAFLAGSNLPPHLARKAYNYLDRLARAAKALGDPRTLPQLRADAYLALLAGEPFRYQPPVDPLSQRGRRAGRRRRHHRRRPRRPGRTHPTTRPRATAHPATGATHAASTPTNRRPIPPDPADPDAADNPTAAGAAPAAGRTGKARPAPGPAARPAPGPAARPAPEPSRLRPPSRVNLIRDRRRHRRRRPRRAGRRGTGPRNAGPTPNPRTYHPTTRTRTSTPPEPDPNRDREPDPQPDREPDPPIQTGNQTGRQLDQATVDNHRSRRRRCTAHRSARPTSAPAAGSNRPTGAANSTSSPNSAPSSGSTTTRP